MLNDLDCGQVAAGWYFRHGAAIDDGQDWRQAEAVMTEAALWLDGLDTGSQADFAAVLLALETHKDLRVWLSLLDHGDHDGPDRHGRPYDLPATAMPSTVAGLRNVWPLPEREQNTRSRIFGPREAGSVGCTNCESDGEAGL